MYCVYILKSIKNPQQRYIGYTKNLKQRLEQHNKNQSFHTSKYAPWKIVYCECYANKENAEDREIKLKQFGKVYSQLMKRIKKSINS